MLVLQAGLIVTLGGAQPTGTPPTVAPRGWVDSDIERQAALVRRLVARADPRALAYVVRLMDDGPPPPVCLAFLRAAADHPNLVFSRPLRHFAGYRRAQFRAAALVALAAIDHAHAKFAVTTAFDDPELEIRMLGLDLAQTHTAPDIEEAVLRMLSRDPEVAARVGRSRSSQTVTP